MNNDGPLARLLLSVIAGLSSVGLFLFLEWVEKLYGLGGAALAIAVLWSLAVVWGVWKLNGKGADDV
jgi:uncharacterized membrane protein YqjE